MKTPDDLKMRVFYILENSGFSAMVQTVSTDTAIKVINETVLITSTGMFTGHDVVNSGNISINLILKDNNGKSDNQRFRYLMDQLLPILKSKEQHEDDFVRYTRDNLGATQTATITPINEWFHFSIGTITDVEHDPERLGYSYISIRLNCWIEK